MISLRLFLNVKIKLFFVLYYILTCQCKNIYSEKKKKMNWNIKKAIIHKMIMKVNAFQFAYSRATSCIRCVPVCILYIEVSFQNLLCDALAREPVSREEHLFLPQPLSNPICTS